MDKIVGNISANMSGSMSKHCQFYLSKRYNASIEDSIRIDGLQDINDAIYLLECIKARIKETEESKIK